MTPASLTFANIPVGTTSAPPKILKLKNTTGSTFTIARMTPADPEFVVTGCMGPLPAKPTSQATVTYGPSGTAKVTDTITITDDASGSPQQVTLSGTGK